MLRKFTLLLIAATTITPAAVLLPATAAADEVMADNRTSAALALPDAVAPPWPIEPQEASAGDRYDCPNKDSCCFVVRYPFHFRCCERVGNTDEWKCYDYYRDGQGGWEKVGPYYRGNCSQRA